MSNKSYAHLSQAFVGMVKAVELTVQSYSGRGMYGKECLAVDIGGMSPGNFFANVYDDVVGTRRYVPTEDEREAFSVALRHHKTDSLGLGTVLYIPCFPPPQDGTDEDDEGGVLDPSEV